MHTNTQASLHTITPVFEHGCMKARIHARTFASKHARPQPRLHVRKPNHMDAYTKALLCTLARVRASTLVRKTRLNPRPLPSKHAYTQERLHVSTPVLPHTSTPANKRTFYKSISCTKAPLPATALHGSTQSHLQTIAHSLMNAYT
jgi:hypothetical protein